MSEATASSMLTVTIDVLFMQVSAANELSKFFEIALIDIFIHLPGIKRFEGVRSRSGTYEFTNGSITLPV